MFEDFMINTWVAGTVVAIVAGVVGFFVVIRGSSFAAHALPLSAFPGAAAANLLGLDPLIGLFAFSAIGVAGISLLARSGREDVATALSLAMLLGLGALFLSWTDQYSQGIFALLFGQILGVSSSKLGPTLALGALTVAFVAALFRPLLLSSVSPELAEVKGVSPRLMQTLFLAILAFATAMALPVVGALLVFSLMVGPASAARTMTNRPLLGIFLSAAISVVTVWGAISLAFVSDWPVGFFVGILSAVAYAAGRIWMHLLQRKSIPANMPAFAAGKIRLTDLE